MERKIMFNQKIKSLEEVENYTIKKIEYHFVDLIALEVVRTHDELFSILIEDMEKIDGPVLFQLQTNFRNLSKADRDGYLLIITNLFASHLFTDDKIEHENRLSPLKVLDPVRLSRLIKMDLDRKALKFPVFGIEFIDHKGKLFHSVF